MSTINQSITILKEGSFRMILKECLVFHRVLGVSECLDRILERRILCCSEL